MPFSIMIEGIVGRLQTNRTKMFQVVLFPLFLKSRNKIKKKIFFLYAHF